jgi:O-antigen ligase
MDFVLLVLVTAVLYIRPAEMIPSLATVPFFEISIILALIVAAPKVAAQFSAEALARRPITVCVLGLFAAAKLSSVLNGHINEFLDTNFAKAITYYLLAVGVLDTGDRIRRFMAAIAVLLSILSLLMVGDFHGWLNIPAYTPVYSDGVPRICATGLLGDPNDVGINMSMAIVLAVAALTRHGSGWRRVLWVAPIYILFTALRLTQSRGAVVALLGGAGMFIIQRLGLIRGTIAAALVLPALVLGIGGRQADISTSGGTGQGRVQLWAGALDQMRGAAFFIGIGPGHLTDYQSHVAHNGFVQAYSEIGLIGGTLFLGAFWYAGTSIYRLRGRQVRVADPEIRGLIPGAGATLACYGAGLMSLSQTFYLLTYVVLAISTAVIDLADPRPRPPGMTLDARLASRILAVGVAGLVVFKVYVRFAVRW